MKNSVPAAAPISKDFNPFTATDAEIGAWLDSFLPDDIGARDAWVDEREAARLRELEAAERIGNDFDHEEA